MSERRDGATGAWLAARLDEAPSELAEAMRELLVGSSARERSGGRAEELGAALADTALRELREVAGACSTERATAHKLLAADAILTCAFEAAAAPELNGGARRADRLAEAMLAALADGGEVAA